MSSALASFEPHRPRLLRIAYRMLGTMADAEDLLQDAYVRWHESDRSAVRTDEALLVTTVTRLAIDRRRRQKTERESYFGTWLPEPWLGDGSATQQVERTDDLSYASMVLLERLSADERAAFLLREVFDVDYEAIASTLEKSEAACRKLVQRAKEHLGQADEAPRHAPSRSERAQLLEQLRAVSGAQDATQLERALNDAVRLESDGGGKVFAARYALEGASRVARALWHFVNKPSHDIEERVVELHGEPALLTYVSGALYAVTFVSVENAQIQALYKVFNPDKLQRLSRSLAG